MASKPEHYIILDFDKGQADRFDLMPRVRDYGEELWRAFRDEPRVVVEFDVIDAAWDRIQFTATSKILAKRAATVAERLLKRANLAATVTIADRPGP